MTAAIVICFHTNISVKVDSGSSADIVSLLRLVTPLRNEKLSDYSRLTSKQSVVAKVLAILLMLMLLLVERGKPDDFRE